MTESRHRVYPEAPRASVVDDYFGRGVQDPFRPLEQASHPDTLSWVEAQNELTRAHLDGPVREAIRRRLEELFDYERFGIPFARLDKLFLTRASGQQNQPVWSLRDAGGTMRDVLDPNDFSDDGTAAVSVFSPSPSASLIAYGVSWGGSDRETILIRDVATGRDLEDRLEWARFTTITWTADSRGFFYSRYPQPGTVADGDEHYFPKLMFHAVGTDQRDDRLVYERPGEREIAFSTWSSSDPRWIPLAVWRSSAGENELHVIDLESQDFEIVSVFTGFASTYVPGNVVGGELIVLTREDAPRGRIIAADLRRGSLRTLMPQGEHSIESIEVCRDAMLVHTLRNARSTLTLHGLDGALRREIDLPGVGSVEQIEPDENGGRFFFSYRTYVAPQVIYQVSAADGALETFQAEKGASGEVELETRQVWYHSTDGTPVSMFLSMRSDAGKDGNRPVFLYGYGGFNLPMIPSFNPVHYYFMEQGGIFAVPNLRGGSEYGEEWHRAGMLDRKENVFADFEAAARWLVDEGWTRPSLVAVSGRSNGGLLAAVTAVRHPELYGAAVVQVPVIDMLRYHRFTVGRFWIHEYGCSENPEHVGFLLRYSPLHNVRDGTKFPPILVTTAEGDDRVDPGQAKKFVARLQEAQGGDAPILLRVERGAGHSSGNLATGGKPVPKLIEEWADIWTFVFTHLGISPR